ncbi:MAG: imidazole glycerol phosphate synthase subunit HisH [Gemmatimonadetes bacterium]|nr:imidazole glycerol phosphate synthase subunit HisH [Gemmatimonadota bacterium]
MMSPPEPRAPRSNDAERAAIGIVSTGVANVEAVRAAFARLKRDTYAVETPEAVASAAFLVLPGVGSFESGMRALQDRGIVDPLVRRVSERRATLAICLGLQLLCDASDEAPDIEGLGCIPGRVSRFAADVRSPQLGWNRIDVSHESRFLRSGFMYFAHSYRLAELPEGWIGASCRHGARFVAAVERGGVLACQFHPELSGASGRRLLARWLDFAPLPTSGGAASAVADEAAAPLEGAGAPC